MRLNLDRKYKKQGYTIGVLSVNGVRLCDTVEDTDRGLKQSMNEMSLKIMKIAGQTAIPAGTYIVTLSISPKFKSKEWAKKYNGLVPEIKNVKAFYGIRIHPGSNANSTEGCLIPGDNKVKGGVINSQKRYFELMDNYLIPAWERKEEITIEIQ